MRKVNTSRFGEIDVTEDKVIKFKDGIPAFEDEHEFIILPYEEQSPYYFMQSLKSPELAFLLTTPFLFFSDYTFELDDVTISELDITNEENLEYYSMITIPNGSVRYMTANLVAPIVLNKENMKAKQVVLENTEYTTKHRLFPDVPIKGV
ncbi:MAG: flagellar assembly protein FliW [Selenomonadaceae bacterium]|nr:flagellar assembly protein FliW [Selenomonadaceae bacterium]